MSDAGDVRRVLLAITETSPLERLWQSLTEHVASAEAEVVVVMMTDDRWRRAASLPFTREISRFSGNQAAFTEDRAQKVGQHAAQRAQKQLQQLAAAAKLRLVFQVLTDDEEVQVRSLVSVACDVLIAPSALGRKPLFAELMRQHREVVLVEVDDEAW